MQRIRPTESESKRLTINESHLIADGFIKIKLPNGKYGYYLPTTQQAQPTQPAQKKQSKSSLCLLY